MKKNILVMILAALLVANISACNYAPEININENTEKFTEDTSYTEAENKESNDPNNQLQSDIYSTQELVETLRLPDTFASVLKNEAMVLAQHFDSEEYIFLQNFIIGSLIEFAFVSAIDLDVNGTKDVVVLESGDKIIILKEYEETVYAWQYNHNAIYNLRRDGTYDWSEQSGNTYGTSKLQFDDARITPIELYRVVNNEQFYINGLEVTQEEFQTYVQAEKTEEKADRYWWQTGFKTPNYQIDGK